MIRTARNEDFLSPATNETVVRIAGLRRTYGLDVPFIQFYSDGDGGLLSIMDGVALFHAEQLSDEWNAFLMMNSAITTIHCSEAIGVQLMATGFWKGRVGVVMKYAGDIPCVSDTLVCHAPYLPAVYDLLKEHFPGISPFDYWYPDVSHRVRHNHSHISAVLDGEKVVSTAMTVAETEDAAVLGQVATHPDFRCRGLAGMCIKSTISVCKGKLLYILPIHSNAQKLYEKLGFVTEGGWAELQRA